MRKARIDQKVNILLVDDQPNNLFLLEETLQSPEYHLVKAASGEDALKYLAEDDFAVILLDVMMPGLDGFETARRIRLHPRSRQIPIIFITGLDLDEDNLAKANSVGTADYLCKPFDIDLLKSKVSGFVDAYKTARQGETAPKRRRDTEAA